MPIKTPEDSHLKELYKKVKERGWVTIEEISDNMDPGAYDPEQLENIIDMGNIMNTISPNIALQCWGSKAHLLTPNLRSVCLFCVGFTDRGCAFV